jgi:histidinol dehydrogenase
MQLYKYPGRKEWEAIIQRPVIAQKGLEKDMRKILDKVKEKGDKAIRKFNREFDGTTNRKLQVSEKELMNAGTLVSEKLRLAIQQAKENIEKFHLLQVSPVQKVETMPGVICWRKQLPIDKVGLYIPGGSAPLFSTILMLAVPATIAGCKEIIMCTPASKEGTVDPAILYTAHLCGIKKIFRVGGAQAIAAMAFGTETIPGVQKIFGPGNQYVTMAKQLVQMNGVAIDMLAGPSEVLIIADESSDPSFVSADLLSQAEHGPDSQVILVSTSETTINKILENIEAQLKDLPRKAMASLALQNSKAILAKNMEEAIAFSNSYAPEHLILSCNEAEKLAENITAAGSVFIGNYSPESAGDYASGTNHVLPTNGNAELGGGVSVDSFVKKITFQQLTIEGIKNIGNTIIEMANAEGLEGHANAVAIRINQLK